MANRTACRGIGLKATCLSLGLLFAFSAQTIKAADRVPGRDWESVSPEQSGWSAEGLATAREFSGQLDTAAVMIVQDGVVIDAWGPTAVPLMCHSVRKSLLSTLFGPHVDGGAIDLNATLKDLGINDNEPSLTDAERNACVHDLLCARSGIYHPALYETAAMAAARPARGSHEPDSFWYYNNWDFNAAGTIFENATGCSLFEEFEDRLAGPLGFQDFQRGRHTEYVTGDDSVHPAYPFELSARDLARFGLLCLRGGRWQDRQLIPASWIEESTQSYSDAGESGGYGYMWWVAQEGRHFPGVELPEGSYSARGYRGHYLVVIPAWDLVVVHRVNTFQDSTRVSKAEFGELLSLILAARPDAEPVADANREAETPAPPALYDVLLQGGEIVDGTGRPRFRADLAIRDGKIAAIDPPDGLRARTIIDVRGRLIAPGFIDLHSHADSGLVSSDPHRRSAPNLVTQGITTVAINQDGSGPQSIRAQRLTMEELGIGLNAAQMIGHGTVRERVLGDDHRRPARNDEIAAMRELVRTGMEEGAFGMSAGLEYVPGIWSTQQEIEALVAELKAFDGVYVVHERSSGSRPMWFLPSRDSHDQPSMLDNLRELIDVADVTGVTVVATHIKARGVDFWGSSARMIEMLEEARRGGLDIYADQYAYNTSGSDGRIVLIPSWVAGRANSSAPGTASMTPAEQLETVLADEALSQDLRDDIAYEIERRGGGEGIVIVNHPNQELVGRTLVELAEQLGSDLVDAAIHLQLDGDAARRGGAQLRAFSMSEQDVEAFAATPWVATSSDAGIALPGDGPVHPRFYGAFPRKIRHYAIDKQLMSIEEAVRVSTSLPASILRLKDRGVLKVGAAADIVVFDPQRIRDTADAFNPHQYSEGIDAVLIGGELVVEQSRPNGHLAGRVLER